MCVRNGNKVVRENFSWLSLLQSWKKMANEGNIKDVTTNNDLQPVWPSTDEGIKKMCIYTLTTLYAAIKINLNRKKMDASWDHDAMQNKSDIQT